ncbi:MAG: hypothetical protein R3326_02025, partial [Gemmatimonadota bacterium]|nr:hypothetical protein [Gemmatimonadota bacterium]
TDRIEETVMDEIDKAFSPEFLNRLDEVIVFHPLTEDHIVQIVDILFREVLERIEDKELELTLSEEAKRFLADEGFDEKFGARPLKRAIQRHLEDPFSEALLQGRFAPGDEIEVRVAEDGQSLEFEVVGSTAGEEESALDESHEESVGEEVG